MSNAAIRQGTYADTAFKNYHDIHYDSQGIICVSQITQGQWKNKYGRYKAMDSYMSNLESLDDVFISQNTFRKFKRSTEHLHELKALYIDLDYHKATNYTREQILGNIEILIEDRKIPRPTHIIDSGHGINLIWKIKRTPPQALPLWRTVEEYLYQTLKEYGADRKALDVARVLRPCDSYNAKYNTKKQVQIISCWHQEYDLHLFKEYIEFVPYKTKKPKQYKTIIRLFNNYSLYYSRYQDILAICKLRQYDLEGHRELVLFLYRYYSVCYSADAELALNNALDLNREFIKPLNETEVLRATKNATKAAERLRYGYRNQTLIDLLAITEEEMQKTNSAGEYYIKSIISKEEKYRRNNVRRKKARRKATGMTKQEEKRNDIMQRIITMRAEAKTQKEIAEALNMSVRNVQKYYKIINETK